MAFIAKRSRVDTVISKLVSLFARVTNTAIEPKTKQFHKGECCFGDKCKKRDTCRFNHSSKTVAHLSQQTQQAEIENQEFAQGEQPLAQGHAYAAKGDKGDGKRLSDSSEQKVGM